jgi:uncharacterized membrane protein YjjP (DUF1212 family)
MGCGTAKTSRAWGFVLSSGVAAAAVVYVFGPADAGVITSLAVGSVVFFMFSVALTVSNGRLKEILIDLLSVFP